MPDISPDQAVLGRGTLVLPADLGIEQVHDLRRILNDVLTQTTPVEIMAADVARIHAAALQLLAAFCRDRRQAGTMTRWSQPSTTLRQAVENLGLSPWIELP